jgi:hypothetical protein
MIKRELELALQKAGILAREREFIVFGSQAILGLMDSPPKACLGSMEVDLYPKTNYQAVLLINAKLGRRSSFSKQHGYFVDCVTPDLATLPDGWTERLVPFQTENTGGITGWCLEIHDLAISKLAASREKDLKYIRVLLRHKLVNPAVIENRLQDLPVNETERARLQTCFRQLLPHPRRK